MENMTAGSERIGAASTQGTPSNHMPYPPYFGLVKIISEISAALGVIIGTISFIMAFPAFEYGFMYGLTAISVGAITVVSALVGLGIIYGFLTLVRAQVDMRNAIIQSHDAIPVNNPGEQKHA